MQMPLLYLSALFDISNLGDDLGVFVIVQSHHVIVLLDRLTDQAKLARRNMIEKVSWV